MNLCRVGLRVWRGEGGLAIEEIGRLENGKMRWVCGGLWILGVRDWRFGLEIWEMDELVGWWCVVIE